MGDSNGHNGNNVETLRMENIKPPFSSGNDVSNLSFNLDKMTVESVANFSGIEIMTIAYKEACRGVG